MYKNICCVKRCLVDYHASTNIMKIKRHVSSRWLINVIYGCRSAGVKTCSCKLDGCGFGSIWGKKYLIFSDNKNNETTLNAMLGVFGRKVENERLNGNRVTKEKEKVLMFALSSCCGSVSTDIKRKKVSLTYIELINRKIM